MVRTKKLAIFAIFLIFVCCSASGCKLPDKLQKQTTAYEVTDITGYTTKMAAKPEKILTLAMTTDDVVLGLVKPDKMAAVNYLLKDPSSSNTYKLAREVKQTIKNPSAEDVIKLQPDLVIAPSWVDGNRVSAMRAAGLKVVVCRNPTTVQQIKENIQLISKAIGEEQKGQQLIEKMDAKLKENAAKVAQIPPAQRKSVVLISLMKTYGGIGSSFNTACELAGVINGKAAIGIKNGQEMTNEQLLKINPDYLLLPTYNDFGKYDTEKFCQQYTQDPALAGLKAIKEHHLVFPRDGYIYNNSQDFVFAVQEIDYCVYGADFKLPNDCHLSVVDDK